MNECDETDSAGDYSIEALEDGQYEVHFGPGNLPYFGQYREGSVTVNGGPFAGVDAELSAAAMITGTVTAAGQPVQGDEVCAGRLPTAREGRCARTGENGSYAIRFATPGDFRVEFQAIGSFATQYFDHKRHAPEAAAVTATLGSVRSAVDASLEAGGWVRGTVRCERRRAAGRSPRLRGRSVQPRTGGLRRNRHLRPVLRSARSPPAATRSASRSNWGANSSAKNSSWEKTTASRPASTTNRRAWRLRVRSASSRPPPSRGSTRTSFPRSRRPRYRHRCSRLSRPRHRSPWPCTVAPASRRRECTASNAA